MFNRDVQTKIISEAKYQNKTFISEYRHKAKCSKTTTRNNKLF